MSRFDIVTRTMGGYPEIWQAQRELKYHQESGDGYTWYIEEQDGLYYVVGEQVLPDTGADELLDYDSTVDLYQERTIQDDTDAYYRQVGEEL